MSSEPSDSSRSGKQRRTGTRAQERHAPSHPPSISPSVLLCLSINSSVSPSHTLPFSITPCGFHSTPSSPFLYPSLHIALLPSSSSSPISPFSTPFLSYPSTALFVSLTFPVPPRLSPHLSFSLALSPSLYFFSLHLSHSLSVHYFFSQSLHVFLSISSSLCVSVRLDFGLPFDPHHSFFYLSILSTLLS